MKPIETFLPLKNQSRETVECPSDYSRRMQATALPQWPSEVLEEWLFRQEDDIEDYAYLDFTRFKFERQVWPLNLIPGPEVFYDPDFMEAFQNIEERAKNKYDPLPSFMLEHGTWNTPIVLLHRPEGPIEGTGGGRSTRSPFHLLEGHRRLSFLNALRNLGRAKSSHEVWIVTLEEKHE